MGTVIRFQGESLERYDVEPSPVTNVNEQPTPKVAVIGCGSWGQNLVRNFSALGALAAVCDRNAESAARMAQKHSVPALTFPEILANPGIASVVISVPAEQHGILVEESLRAGKHVFVEKPLALRVPDAERALELAEDRGLTLMVGHLLQYHPAFMKLKGMCEAGDLGRLRYVYSNRLNLGKFRVEENILWSFAPHDISMILGLFHDLPETILATGHCFLHSSIADVTTTHLAFAAGQAAHIHVSWLHPFKEQRLVVIGESAMAVFDDRLDWEKKLCVYNHSVRWRGNVPEPTQGDGRFIALDRVEPLAI
jgi:predicted dehydrogenase